MSPQLARSRPPLTWAPRASRLGEVLRLDAANAAAVAALLAGIARHHGTTILCATHEELVLAACDDRIALEEPPAATLGR